MSYTIIRKLPPIESILQDLPLSDQALAQINQDRKDVKNILTGKDKRLLIIVGPCSAWPSEAVIEYAKKLTVLKDQISDVIKIVMRVYIQKPRTARGWTGPINQPDPLGQPDIENGIRRVRQMMIEVINLGLPIAGEALFTHNAKGFIELLSWVAIGARSTEDQEHRIYASSLDIPVGMKNPTHGSLEVGVNGIIAAQHPHVAVFDSHEVQTHGNPLAHLVLRGSNGSPNYSLQYLEESLMLMQTHQIKNPAVIIDTSHDNCIIDGVRNHLHQPQVIRESLEMIKDRPALKALVKGFMIESFIKDGNQKVDPHKPEDLDYAGLSITDPCLSWEATESLLMDLARRLR